jgi:hypothetical protein
LLAVFSFRLCQNAKEHNGGTAHDQAKQDQETRWEIGLQEYRSDAHNLCS